MLISQTSDEQKKASSEALLKNLQHHKQTILNNSLKNFYKHNLHTIKIGAELEFYLLQKDDSKVDEEIRKNFITSLAEKLRHNSLIYKIEKEQGVGQIEIKILFDADLAKVCQTIEEAVEQSKNLAETQNLLACFAAQKFSDDCGSALQFNISMHDNQDYNLFSADKNLVTKYASVLLEKTNEILILLASNTNDYRRFCPQINRELFKSGKYSAPINLSFGADNRTCAIRIPQKSQRLEYRVACANADPFLAISAILLTISQNVEAVANYPQIYGNAFDQQYNLKTITSEIEKARTDFLESEICQKLQQML